MYYQGSSISSLMEHPLPNRTQQSNLGDLHELSAEGLNNIANYREEDQKVFQASPSDSKKENDVQPPKTWGQNEINTHFSNLRIVLPHIGLVIISTAYTLLGAAIFHHFEMPFEIRVRNETAQRVNLLKQRIVKNLWNLLDADNKTLNISFTNWSDIAHRNIDDVIRDVFFDYTRNYMSPDDIIKGSGPVKWSFGSSIFFSWTAITTIGYGHIVPRTTEGRIACLLYTLLGIPLILITIADMGRFLSGGVLWVNNMLARLRRNCLKKIRFLCKLCCQRPALIRKSETEMPLTSMNHVNTNLFSRKRRSNHGDNVSDAGTFENISEIQNQDADRTLSDDTRARADEVGDEYSVRHDDRISLLFVLVIMIGYTAGGAFLLQLWEKWNFFESFYFCFVTVTTIGFGDIVPQNMEYLPATLTYIIIGLIITTMCIDLVGSVYIRDIHFYGRTLGRQFMTIGGKVVQLSEVFGYVALLQRQYGLTAEQINKLAQLPEDYLLECLMSGKQPDLRCIGRTPYVPQDIYYYKWIEHPRTLSIVSNRVCASMESLGLNSNKCSTTHTLTPREYYQQVLLQYCRQVHYDDAALNGTKSNIT